MPPGHERLLVGRRDDLARPEGRQDGPQADHPAGADDDEIDVVARGQCLQRLCPADPLHPSGQIQRRETSSVTEGDRRRPEPRRLDGELFAIGAGCQGDDVEGLGMGGEDFDRLTTDRAGRAEQGDSTDPEAVPAGLSG